MMVASKLRDMQGFQLIMNFLVMPMFFLSGAMFPAAGLPAWLAVLTRLAPLAYAVDPMRRAVFAHIETPAQLAQRLNPGMTWFGWHLPVGLELALVAAGAAAALLLAIWQFSRTE